MAHRVTKSQTQMKQLSIAHTHMKKRIVCMFVYICICVCCMRKHDMNTQDSDIILINMDYGD